MSELDSVEAGAEDCSRLYIESDELAVLFRMDWRRVVFEINCVTIPEGNTLIR